MPFLRTSSLAFIGASLLACSDAASVVAPTRKLAADAALAADKESNDNEGTKQSVVGEALFDPTDQGVSDVHYSVEGKRHKDGKVDGEFRMTLMRDGSREHFKGEVSCFSIAGNSARVSVRVERSDNPNVKRGQYLLFTVIDDDQSPKTKGTSPDRTSFFFRFDSEAAAETHCTFGMNFATYPLRRGHFELHPEPKGAGSP